jgi:plasmid maintenance system antidote protein VapI
MVYASAIRPSTRGISPEESKLNTPEYLDLVRATLGLPSDYALQKPLGISKSLVSAYRTGRESLSDAMAVKVAQLSGKPTEIVLLDAKIERAKSPEEKAAWSAILEKISRSFKPRLLRSWQGVERRSYALQ